MRRRSPSTSRASRGAPAGDRRPVGVGGRCGSPATIPPRHDRRRRRYGRALRVSAVADGTASWLVVSPVASATAAPGRATDHTHGGGGACGGGGADVGQVGVVEAPPVGWAPRRAAPPDPTRAIQATGRPAARGGRRAPAGAMVPARRDTRAGRRARGDSHRPGAKLAAAGPRAAAHPLPVLAAGPTHPDAFTGLLDELLAWLAAVYLRYIQRRRPARVLAVAPDVVEELLWLMHAWLAPTKAPPPPSPSPRTGTTAAAGVVRRIKTNRRILLAGTPPNPTPPRTGCLPASHRARCRRGRGDRRLVGTPTRPRRPRTRTPPPDQDPLPTTLTGGRSR